MQWNEACQITFMKIKDLCCSATILAFADFSKPFTLHIEASGIGLGAMLYQELEAKEWVISLRSTVFHQYLYGNTFTVNS